MTSPIAVRIIIIDGDEQEDYELPNEIGSYSVLYGDGEACFMLIFANEDAYSFWNNRMYSLKDRVELLNTNYPTPMHHQSSEFRDAVKEWLGMVALAAQDGFVLPSILATQAEFAAAVDAASG
jgi:hypothetical protein